MGKLTDRLKSQCKNPDRKKDAEDCIRIYDWIKKTDKEGRVWSSRWAPLVDVIFKGNERTFKPTISGYTLLKGIDSDIATSLESQLSEARAENERLKKENRELKEKLRHSRPVRTFYPEDFEEESPQEPTQQDGE